jgi:trehalose 6-phosphate phosphatase
LLDFDGTLSEIAPTPEAAILHPAAVEPLEKLSRKLALVSVVSGRSASVIHEKVGIEAIVYVGNHGAENIVNGMASAESRVSESREKLKAAFDYLQEQADGPGIIWEDKGFSMAVHYRLAPDTVVVERRFRKSLESTPFTDELEIFWGRMVLEMRVPTGLNKGSALRKLASEWNLASVIFVGDDTTDLDAMLELVKMRDEGKLRGLNLLVVHENSSKALLDAADYSLDSVADVGRFLQMLDTSSD